MAQSAPPPGTLRDLAVLLAPGLGALAAWKFGAAPVIVLGLGALGPLVGITLLSARTRSLRSAEERLRTTLARLRRSLGDDPGVDATAEEASEDRLEHDLSDLVRRSHAAASRVEQVETGLTDARAALDASEEFVLLFAPRGTVRLANRAAVDFFSQGAAPLHERHIEDLFAQKELLDLYAAAAVGQLRREEVVIAGRQGRRVFNVTAMPVDLPSAGRCVLLMLRDVTEHQSALRLGGDFVASVSHELRTPLASIKAALETLRDSARDDPIMSDRLLGMIGVNADRLEALTTDVLRLSQLESSGARPEMEPVEVRPVLDSISSLLEPLLSERSLRIEYDVPESLRVIRTDPRLFELILKNLLENAAKFAFESTSIRVVAVAIDEATRWQVTDRGIGIPLNQQQRIFDRFYQVDSARTGSQKRRGTGLGLAIVQNAVRALGGTIRVESVWQQGTTMTVELPGSLGETPSAE